MVLSLHRIHCGAACELGDGYLLIVHSDLAGVIIFSPFGVANHLGAKALKFRIIKGLTDTLGPALHEDSPDKIEDGHHPVRVTSMEYEGKGVAACFVDQRHESPRTGYLCNAGQEIAMFNEVRLDGIKHSGHSCAVFPGRFFQITKRKLGVESGVKQGKDARAGGIIFRKVFFHEYFSKKNAKNTPRTGVFFPFG